MSLIELGAWGPSLIRFLMEPRSRGDRHPQGPQWLPPIFGFSSGPPPFEAIREPDAFPVKFQDVAVMSEPVQESGGQRRISKDRGPLGKGKI